MHFVIVLHVLSLRGMVTVGLLDAGYYARRLKVYDGLTWLLLGLAVLPRGVLLTQEVPSWVMKSIYFDPTDLPFILFQTLQRLYRLSASVQHHLEGNSEFQEYTMNNLQVP